MGGGRAKYPVAYSHGDTSERWRADGSHGCDARMPGREVQKPGLSTATMPGQGLPSQCCRESKVKCGPNTLFRITGSAGGGARGSTFSFGDPTPASFEWSSPLKDSRYCCARIRSASSCCFSSGPCAGPVRDLHHFVVHPVAPELRLGVPALDPGRGRGGHSGPDRREGRVGPGAVPGEREPGAVPDLDLPGPGGLGSLVYARRTHLPLHL